MTEFVENWEILHTVGEGAFGEVKLLVHRVTGDTVAVKIIDCKKHKDAAACVKKEICIHRLLVHPNIIRYYGQRQEGYLEYIFLEYASGGELFNKIEPDVGMPNWEAQKYFRQLLQGLEYLHDKGVAHRDIKPENLLLDHNSNLKITDFGMATVFRYRGQERLLDKRCGTLPYLAPEVLERSYHARPADIWSCGIVLVALLAGELPWDSPVVSQPEYSDWVEGKYMLLSPWKKIDNMALSLLRRILLPDSKQRYTLENIAKHRWLHTSFLKCGGNKMTEVRPSKRMSSNLDISVTDSCNESSNDLIGKSQPVLQKEVTTELIPIGEDVDVCFSQPTHFDDLLISSQLQFTQSHLTKNNFEKLVSRMTRFFVKTDLEKTLEILCKSLEDNALTWKASAPGQLTITTVDSRKMQLVFKANIISMDNKLLLDFRLSKGCGIEFKKRFVRLKLCLREIITNDDKI